MKLNGERLNKILKERGLRRADLARAIGVDAGNLTHQCNDKGTPFFIRKVADYLDVDAYSLMDFEDGKDY